MFLRLLCLFVACFIQSTRSVFLGFFSYRRESILHRSSPVNFRCCDKIRRRGRPHPFLESTQRRMPRELDGFAVKQCYIAGPNRKPL